MTRRRAAWLTAIATVLAVLVPRQATVAGLTVHPQAALVIILLAAAAAVLAIVARSVRACPSSPYPCR